MRLWLVVVAAAALLTACEALEIGVDAFEQPTPTEEGSLEADLAANLAKWSSQNITTYSMELSFGREAERFSEGCAVFDGWLLIQVIDGRVQTALDQFSGCRVNTADPGPTPLTVEDLFGLIEENLAAQVIDVDFEPELGYPLMVFTQSRTEHTEVWVSALTRGIAGTETADAVLSELSGQRELWATQKITDYTITVLIGCFCPPEFQGPFEVTVVDGAVERVTSEGDPVDPERDSVLTVGGLFETVERYAYSDRITVTYSPLGYPQTIDIDPVANAIDEELRIDVIDFASES